MIRATSEDHYVCLIQIVQPYITRRSLWSNYPGLWFGVFLGPFQIGSIFSESQFVLIYLLGSWPDFWTHYDYPMCCTRRNKGAWEKSGGSSLLFFPLPPKLPLHVERWKIIYKEQGCLSVSLCLSLSISLPPSGLWGKSMQSSYLWTAIFLTSNHYSL